MFYFPLSVCVCLCVCECERSALLWSVGETSRLWWRRKKKKTFFLDVESWQWVGGRGASRTRLPVRQATRCIRGQITFWWGSCQSDVIITDCHLYFFLKFLPSASFFFFFFSKEKVRVHTLTDPQWNGSQ